jgi:hypothetical protein
VQAGILEDRRPDSGVRAAVLADPDLAERQKQVLLEIYESFRRETALNVQAGTGAEAAHPGSGPGTVPESAVSEGASADGESTDLGSIIAPGRTGTGSTGTESTGTESTGTESTGDGSDGTDQRAPARKRRRTTQAGLPVQARESETRNESHH